MKKLFTILFLFSITVCMFADPKFPKYSFDDDEQVPYIYVSNDCQTVYELKAIFYPSKKNAILSFNNYSLVVPTHILITIEFSSEKKLDEYIKNIDLSDIENSFKRIRLELIKKGITPSISEYNSSGKSSPIKEEETVYGYGYDNHYDWKNLPNIIGYKASY